MECYKCGSTSFIAPVKCAKCGNDNYVGYMPEFQVKKDEYEYKLLDLENITAKELLAYNKASELYTLTPDGNYKQTHLSNMATYMDQDVYLRTEKKYLWAWDNGNGLDKVSIEKYTIKEGLKRFSENGARPIGYIIEVQNGNKD